MYEGCWKFQAGLSPTLKVVARWSELEDGVPSRWYEKDTLLHVMLNEIELLVDVTRTCVSQSACR